MIEKKFRLLLQNGNSNEQRATVEYISNGESIEIECSTNMNTKKLLFLKDQKEINFGKTVGNGKKIILKIDNFDAHLDAGTYTCASLPPHADEQILILKKRNQIGTTSYVEECEENFCRNGGKCFVPLTGDKTKFCSCPTEYAGQFCESHAISSYAVQGTRAGMLIWSLAAPIVILFLVGVAAFLAARYKHERVKRKKYECAYGKLMPKPETAIINGNRFPGHVQPVEQVEQVKQSPVTQPARIELEDLEDFEHLDNQAHGHYFKLLRDDIQKKKKPRERLQATSDWSSISPA